MPARWLLVTAIVAALLGAPSVVSGAGNELVEAEASPLVGTTETIFKLRVGYLGVVPALGVEAHVARRSLPMQLVDGSLLVGAWAASTTLPPGTWPVAFTATTQLGDQLSLAGPTLTVVEAVPSMTPSDAASGGPAPEAAATPNERPAPSGAAEPAVPPPGTEPPPAAPVGPTPTPSRADGAEPMAPTPGGATRSGDAAPVAGTDRATGATSTPEPSPHIGQPRTSEVRGTGRSPEPERQAGSGSVGERRLDGAAIANDRSAAPEVDERRVDDELAALGIVATASLAAVLVGLAAVVVLATRRRARRAAAAEAIVAAHDAATILRERALRRARVRVDDEEDPIIAALNLDEEEQRPPGRRRRDGERGPEAGRPRGRSARRH